MDTIFKYAVPFLIFQSLSILKVYIQTTDNVNKKAYHLCFFFSFPRALSTH